MGVGLFCTLSVFWCFGLILLFAYLDDEGKLESIPKFLRIIILIVLLIQPLLFIPFVD